MADSETAAALGRAARRAAFHLLRAGIEGLKALEAVVDELAKVGRTEDGCDDSGDGRPVHINVE